MCRETALAQTLAPSVQTDDVCLICGALLGKAPHVRAISGAVRTWIARHVAGRGAARFGEDWLDVGWLGLVRPGKGVGQQPIVVATPHINRVQKRGGNMRRRRMPHAISEYNQSTGRSDLYLYVWL